LSNVRRDNAHAEGEVSPRGRAKVPAYPLCGGFTPATPPIQSLFFELSASLTLFQL
jgi:hypothetical protein